MIGRLAKWFFVLCDPQHELSGYSLRPLSMPELKILLDTAGHHGVTAIMRAGFNLPQVADNVDAQALANLNDLADHRLRRITLQSMLLRHHLSNILELAHSNNIPAMEIKGVDFADNIYPHPSLRRFTDLDIITRRESLGALAELVKKLEIQPIEENGLKHNEQYGEDAFSIRDPSGIPLRLELHWNLVNSPALRRGISVEYDDIVSNGEITREARLIIAAVHGATSHQFDRLKFLFDVLQAIRSGVGKFDMPMLKELVARTGSGAALTMSCLLVKKLCGEKAGQEIVKELGLPALPIIDRILLSDRVISPHTPVILRKARMCGYRHRLKKKRII